jgi:hypothetical protein
MTICKKNKIIYKQILYLYCTYITFLMTEKSVLPFEIIESKDTIDKDKNKIKAGLKKIEIFASPEQVDEIILEIESLHLEATLYDSHGYGQSKQKIRSGKAGTQTATISSSRKTIVTIANSNILEELVKKLST